MDTFTIGYKSEESKTSRYLSLYFYRIYFYELLVEQNFFIFLSKRFGKLFRFGKGFENHLFHHIHADPEIFFRGFE